MDLYISNSHIKLQEGLSFGMSKDKFLDSYILNEAFFEDFLQNRYAKRIEDSSFRKLLEREILKSFSLEENISWREGCTTYSIVFENDKLTALESIAEEC